MTIQFKIIVPSYNCAYWIEKSLESLAQQNYPHYEICVIDDASTDPKQWEIIQSFCKKYSWIGIRNKENHGALYNIVQGFKYLNPKDEDVLFILDGDDCLFDKNVLSKLNDYYQKEELYLSYGQYLSFPTWKRGLCKPISHSDIKTKNFRKLPWLFSQLRTFKFFLWKNIRDEDLRDKDGKYFTVAWDLALMFPMLEMAGKHLKYTNDIFLIYNEWTPLNDSKIRRQQQLDTGNYIRSLPSYPTLLHGSCEISNKTRWNTFTLQMKRLRLRLREIYRKKMKKGIYADAK